MIRQYQFNILVVSNYLFYKSRVVQQALVLANGVTTSIGKQFYSLFRTEHCLFELTIIDTEWNTINYCAQLNMFVMSESI